MSNTKSKSAIRYSEEFKKSSVKLAITTDQSLRQTAENIGVSKGTLSNWVSKYSGDENGSEINYLDEIKRLKKELQQARLERDLLKKAAAYFAKESQ